MRILIVSKVPTHPVVAGNCKFILNQIELFKKLGCEVYYLYVEEKPLRSRNSPFSGEVAEMRSYYGDNLFVYSISKFQKIKINLLSRYRQLFNHGYEHCDDEYPDSLGKFVNKLNAKYNFDCCIANYYTLSKLFCKVNIPLKGLTTHDYFSYKNMLVDSNHSWMATTADQEAKALQRVPNIFALNTEEEILFNKLSPRSTVYCVFSTFEYKETPIVGNHDILYFSSKNPFSLNGLRWFVKDIFLYILDTFPDARLLIAGSICKVIEKEIVSDNIKLIGIVDDPYDFFKRADVAINPTYQGTGLKIKTFESIGYDKVTMVHPHSLVGIFDKEKAPLFASTNPIHWVDYLKKVWNGTDEISKIKERNHSYISDMNEYVECQYKKFLGL